MMITVFLIVQFILACFAYGFIMVALGILPFSGTVLLWLRLAMTIIMLFVTAAFVDCLVFHLKGRS